MTKIDAVRTAVLRRTWGSRTHGWHDHVTESPGFARVRSHVLEACHLRGDEYVVDLGAGSGFLALELRPFVQHVLAVDLAPAMLDKLQMAAVRSGTNVDTQVADLRSFDLPSESVDLVVSSYALHHLTDRDKQALLERSARWLRPGGRLVIADMMFGRGGSRHDRQILRQKTTALLSKGPGGVVRLAKAAYRYGLRIGVEQPAPPAFWVKVAREAGFVSVSYTPIVAEAGLLVGQVPLG